MISHLVKRVFTDDDFWVFKYDPETKTPKLGALESLRNPKKQE